MSAVLTTRLVIAHPHPSLHPTTRPRYRRSTQVSRPTQPPTSAVRGGASLDHAAPWRVFGATRAVGSGIRPVSRGRLLNYLAQFFRMGFRQRTIVPTQEIQGDRIEDGGALARRVV